MDCGSKQTVKGCVCGDVEAKLVSKPGGVGNLFTRVSGDKCF